MTLLKIGKIIKVKKSNKCRTIFTNTCKECARPFWFLNSIAIAKQRVYCSFACRDKGFSPGKTLYSGICKTCKNIFYVSRPYNYRTGNLIMYCSPGCGHFKGGSIHHSGYRYRHVLGKNVFEHRLVMEKVLKRKLRQFERIHHKNGNKLDNKPSNLELWAIHQPSGQRVEDLIEWVIDNYPSEVKIELKRRRGNNLCGSRWAPSRAQSPQRSV